MTKSARAISEKIAIKISEGMTIDQAVDFVLGSGAFLKIASEVYDAFKNGGGK